MTITLPGPTLGVVGGGQLGRMIGEAVAPLGVDIIVLDPTPGCPASPVVSDQIVAGFDDPEGIRELASRADALTFEIELADPDLMAEAAAEHDVPVHPDPDTLRTIQDKLVQKEALVDAGIPVPEFVAVATAEGLERVVEEYGGVMLKAREGGYDGRGNVPVDEPADAADALDEIGGAAMAEEFLDFEREIAVMGLKGADGETRTYPVTETIHREEILRESVAPARTDDAVVAEAESVARDVLDVLDGRGVFGIELFETRDGEVLVNEIAPRPHNSGHWTIEGARTSQFENHVRAVLGWPLGSTDLVAPAVTANVLGDVEETQPAALSGVEEVLAAPEADVHWYGKDDVRPLRKMGHLTATDRDANADRDALLSRSRDLRDGLTFRNA
ncbi:5-(carboxyamino)imidazole ribonucleotide synthase [Halorubrum lacusprofundi]|jgi:5-(carboxyamino)imidazole ribonucleotide synthase|uniref:N5-carboxyaminoimidazole ribonucleotide synthase n=1 Tax=Halorubrum lacusprofundi (strain ATCC 49239 / DSM 5036 / JCM 8891 / ACAM 34) TaxID=416348 RepID=B9LUE5_HALLT|nr:5-(carboxyamino)imidazole ribonucleotide synthase [Halorubrum lacusprofundi]ACM56302.1 phosphoribosylaminoimidazole carboxylase, ATPase subunit [Halorubrum lacusprofundi ATCC 49239]MCG1005390.1 5-(carboxyamino)imidazole ribonucleotide synthase [Halorubrum lacusprofundi]